MFKEPKKERCFGDGCVKCKHSDSEVEKDVISELEKEIIELQAIADEREHTIEILRDTIKELVK